MRFPNFNIVEEASTGTIGSRSFRVTTFAVYFEGERVFCGDTEGEADSYVTGARQMYGRIFAPNEYGETPVIYFP